MSTREVTAAEMLLDLQKLVSKNVEIIQSIGEIISTLNERVTRLEERMAEDKQPKEIFPGTLKTLEDL